MWKAFIAAGVIFGSAFALSTSNVGFDRAGKYYLQQKKNDPKSVRTGSSVPRVGGSSGGLHSGK